MINTDKNTCPLATHFMSWLLVITLLGLGVRCWELDTPSFDHDEAYEYLHRNTSLLVLINRHDGFPPLYRWIVSGIAEATGSHRSIRWFSVIFGTLTIPLVGLLGRTILNTRAGLFGALFLATSACHILLSQNARPYCFYIFLCSLMILAAWRVRRDNSWFAWTGFLASSWLTIATHYYGGLLLLILGSMLLVEKRGKHWWRAIWAAGIMAAICVPLYIPLTADLADTGDFYYQVKFDIQAYAYSYLWLITGNTFGPSVSQLREMGGMSGIQAMLPWALIAFVPTIALATSAWKHLKASDRTWLIFLLILPQPLTLMTAGIAPTGFNYRYFAWMVVPLVMFLGCGAAFDRHKPWRTLCTLVLLGIGFFATFNRHYDPRYTESDFHSVVKLIEEESVDSVPAVLTAPLYHGEGVLFTLPDEWLTQNLTCHPSGKQNWETVLPEFASKLDDQKVVWLVLQWFPSGHPQYAISQQLVARTKAKLVSRVTPTIMVYRLSVEAIK